MMKCYGDFVCEVCCTISHKSFEIESENQVPELGVECPGCGRFVQQTIPSKLKVIIRNMTLKGYHTHMIFRETLGVAFAPKLTEIDEAAIPAEFTLDTTEEKYDIIVNARLQADDFEDISSITISDEPCKDKEDYINKSVINLLNWVRTLPQVGVGREINLDEKPEEDDEDAGNGSI